jgi:hypothetical protein
VDVDVGVCVDVAIGSDVGEFNIKVWLGDGLGVWV